MVTVHTVALVWATVTAVRPGIALKAVWMFVERKPGGDRRRRPHVTAGQIRPLESEGTAGRQIR